MATILVTGASGWVGSVIAVELAARGHRLVVLMRGKGRDGPGEVLSGDITLPGANVRDADRARWTGRVDVVLHLAAAVRLDDRGWPELERTNIGGTRHMLELATALGARTFCFMSSCAVAGDAAVFTEHDVDLGQRFRNGYERSKHEAERLVRAWPGRAIIIRMPGLVGDSTTGASRSFAGAYYNVLETYWTLRTELELEWRTPACAEMVDEGIRFDDGVLHLPVQIPCSPDSPSPLVPQDWLASMVAELLEVGDAVGTFHVVDPRPPTVATVLEHSLAKLAISGGAPGIPGPWTRMARRYFDRCLRHHYPYLAHMPRLTTENLPRVLGKRYVVPPAIDEALLGRVIRYAIERGFRS